MIGGRGVLPEDGPVTVGSIALPAGRRQYTDEDDELAAWVTAGPVPDAGLTWLALSAAQPETGLIPVLLQGVGPDPGIPGDREPFFGFRCRAGLSYLEQMSAANILAAAWDGYGNEWAGLGEEAFARYRGPFGKRFPGLASAETVALPPAELRGVAAALPPAHLGLVSAARPADVPATVGWSVFGTDFNSPDPRNRDFYEPGARSLEIGAVLRSWEERFGARLLRIGGDAILQVLAERPPATMERALKLAAECFVFCDEFDRQAGRTVEDIAGRLLGSPVWVFWWD